MGEAKSHLSSHLGWPSSCQPVSGFPTLHALSRTHFPSFPPECVPTPVCALSLSLGEWCWLTPCSGDKFWRNSEGSGKYPGVGNSHRSSILAWKIPWKEEPGHLQAVGSQRVKHDWACTHRHRHLCLCLQSLEWEPNKALRIICGFCYFWKKIQINHFKLKYISYTQKFSFEHYILVIAYLYSCVAIITIWSRRFYILSPYKDT